MIKAVIVDDERKGTLTLSKLLEVHCPEVELKGVALNCEEGIAQVKKHQPDLVFLDIEMQGETGFDLLKQFPDPDFTLIFVTAHSQYAIKGYKHSAIDYLLKPIDTDELKTAICKVKKAVQFNSHSGITVATSRGIEIPSSDGLIYLSQPKIIRLQANGAYTHFYLENNEEHIVSYNIKKYEDKLDGELFMRVHKSHIINLSKVKKFQRLNGYFALMTDGSKIEIARRHKESFFERMHKNG